MFRAQPTFTVWIKNINLREQFPPLLKDLSYFERKLFDRLGTNFLLFGMKEYVIEVLNAEGYRYKENEILPLTLELSFDALSILQKNHYMRGLLSVMDDDSRPASFLEEKRVEPDNQDPAWNHFIRLLGVWFTEQLSAARLNSKPETATSNWPPVRCEVTVMEPESDDLVDTIGTMYAVNDFNYPDYDSWKKNLPSGDQFDFSKPLLRVNFPNMRQSPQGAIEPVYFKGFLPTIPINKYSKIGMREFSSGNRNIEKLISLVSEEHAEFAISQTSTGEHAVWIRNSGGHETWIKVGEGWRLAPSDAWLPISPGIPIVLGRMVNQKPLKGSLVVKFSINHDR